MDGGCARARLRACVCARARVRECVCAWMDACACVSFKLGGRVRVQVCWCACSCVWCAPVLGKVQVC